MNAFTSLFKADMLDAKPEMNTREDWPSERVAFLVFRDEMKKLPIVVQEHYLDRLFHALYPNNPHQYAQALERRLAMEEK